MFKKVRLFVALLALGLGAGGLALAGPDSPQAVFSLSWGTVDGGGGASSGGSYALRGTTGQADAGSVAGGAYVLTSGFWNTTLRPTFDDVLFDYWAWQYIEALYNSGVTAGCSLNPSLFCPESSVTRAQMAVFLLKGIHGAGYVPPEGVGVFDDVPDGYWAEDWIEELYSESITAGCSTNPPLFCPEGNVTRAQMAVFLLKSSHGAGYVPPEGVGLFDDVPDGYWAEDWIEQLYNEGITAGCSILPPLYCPESDVTRAQMAVFLVKTFNLPLP